MNYLIHIAGLTIGLVVGGGVLGILWRRSMARCQCRQMECLQALQAAQTQAAGWQGILGTVPLGVVVADRELHVTFANEAALAFLRKEWNAVAGKSVGALLPAGCADLNALAQSAILGRAPVEVQSRMEFPDQGDARRTLKIQAAARWEADGRLAGVVLTLADCTSENEQLNKLQLQHSLMRLVAERVNLEFFLCDSHGKIRLKKTNSTRMWGVDARGHYLPPEQWVYPEDLCEFLAWRKRLLTERNSSAEFRYRALINGEIRHFEIFAGTIGYGGVEHVAGCVRDISEQTSKKLDLSHYEMIFDNVLADLSVFSYLKDVEQDFRYVMCSKKTLIRPPEEIIGKNDFDLFPPSIAQMHHDDDIALLHGGSTVMLERQLVNGFGEPLHVRIFKKLLRGPDERRLILTLMYDITEEKRREQERNQLVANLRQAVEQTQVLNHMLEAISAEEDVYVAMSKVARLLGSYLHADYCFYDEYLENNTLAHPFGEWNSERTRPTLAELPEAFPISPEEEWFQRLERDGILMMSGINPGEKHIELIGSWNDYFAEYGIRAFAAVPLFKAGRIWGHIFLGFLSGENDRLLSQAQQSLLKSAAQGLEILLLRQQNLRELARSEYEKRLIMDTIKIPILFYDADLNLLRANNAAREIAAAAGVGMDSAGPDDFFRFPGEDKAAAASALAVKDGNLHAQALTLNGRDFLLSAYPVNIDGTLQYVLETLVDTTSFNESQRRLNEALTAAQNANKAKSYFLATMSHELRTPLNAVIGFSELLKNTQLQAEEQADCLNSISLAGNALLSLINDVLELSKIESEQLVIEPAPTDVAALLREIVAIFGPKAREKALPIQLNCPGELPDLMLDTLRLRQIALNLIGNAVKFTARGMVEIAVEFAPDSSGANGTLAVRVRDTGIGIEPEGLKKLFQPFTQQNTLRDTLAYKGTGLGLAISQRLAVRMGGRIDVESTPGVGSTFTVVLNDISCARREVKNPAVAPSGEVPALAYGGRVLVIDDVPMNLKVLGALLKRCGVDCLCVESGLEALTRFDNEPFDLVLTDLWMPEMNGMELAARLRQRPAGASMSIIALTADAEARDNFDVSNFDGVLLKPVTLEKIREILNVAARKEKTECWNVDKKG